jgi:hypothetical protein
VTTTKSNITTDMTPAEAANLLARLDEGNQAVWLSTRELSWHSAEYEPRFQNAAEIDGLFRDIMRETVENGMRHPGEPLEEFAERATSQAPLADTRRARAETDARLLAEQADADAVPECTSGQEEITTQLLNDASTPEGQAHARAFSDAAAARVKELRARAPLPEPDRTPGAAHPDPFLAGRGWHANKHGIYSRGPQPQGVPEPEKEPEAG